MKPITAFSHNIKAAEEMVRLSELLSGRNVRKIRKERAASLKRVLRWRKPEVIDRSANEYLYVIIRGAAEVDREYFDEDGLSFLLRQGVVAACSAMDCYFLEKVEENIWAVVSKMGDDAPPDLLKVRITVADYLGSREYKRKGWALKPAIMNSIRFGSFQSPDAIKEKLQLLGVKNFWNEVADALGKRPAQLKRELKQVVDRRNQIVHKGDRPGNKQKDIDRKWVKKRIDLIDRAVHAADTVIDTQVAALQPTTSS